MTATSPPCATTSSPTSRPSGRRWDGGGNDFVFEPSFYRFDRLGKFHLEHIAPEAAAESEKTPTDTEARAAVLDLRRRLAEHFDDMGGVHIQVRKYYD